MLSDRPALAVASRQNAASRFTASDRDACVHADAGHGVEKVWSNSQESPTITTPAHDDAMIELISDGVAAGADRACNVDGTKPASLLPAAAAVVGLIPVGGHAVGRCSAGNGEWRAVPEGRDRPGQARVGSLEEFSEIGDRIAHG